MATIINKILFCSDLKKSSITVFEKAMALALQTDASISMIHVFEEDDAVYKGELVDWMDHELYTRIRKKRQVSARDVLISKQKGMSEIQRVLKDYFEKTGKDKQEYKDIPIDAIEVKEGNPSLVIPEFAESNGCDLIMIGYHQNGTFLKALIESGKKNMLRSGISIFLVPLG